ncbi:MAG: acyl-CoA carboxylase subunit beta [Bacteroidales bacterium]|nr:acyl-CoA carboxylase subunit beta [Bacteroidales bacterium]
MNRQQEKVSELVKRRSQARSGGGEEKTSARRTSGRMTARERIASLLDEGSFEEYDCFSDGEVVAGCGTIDGRQVYVYSYDFTVHGGSLTLGGARKICKVMDMALKCGAPVISLCESGGARIEDGVDALAGYGEVLARSAGCSGVVPQICAVLGPCAGGAVYAAALSDFTVMTKGSSQLFVNGPSVAKGVTGEDVSAEELGGSEVHASKSGVIHHVEDDEGKALEWIRELVGFLPSNNMEDAPCGGSEDDVCRVDDGLNSIVPDAPGEPFDMDGIIASVVDGGRFIELQESYARNMITGLARIGGATVGVVANRSEVLSGVIDSAAARKAARFVRFCDAFNVPVVTFVDTPGFLGGTRQECSGIISHGAKLVYAYAEAGVPKITITVRKSYGGAHIAMGSKQLGADVNYAWPSAEIAVMGPAAASTILGEGTVGDFDAKCCNPYAAAEKGYVDDVIEPRNTRFRIARALKALSLKRQDGPAKRHDNLPL